MAPLARVDRLSFAYPGSAWALRDVSLEIPGKAITALLGPNGAGKSSLVLAVGGQEGKAYAVSDWEDRFRARGEWTKGRREEALAILRRAAEEHAHDGATFYDLACMEAMTGEHDAAVEHLGQAIAIRPAAREWAQDDAELDPIRDRPDFPA